MSHKGYVEKVKGHLEYYKREILKIKENGIFKYRGEGVDEPHILPLRKDLAEKEAKRFAVKEHNQLESVKKKSFLIIEDLHRYAHHLNSSQLMCYNFFRPFVVQHRYVLRPDKKLIDLLSNKLEIQWKSDAICQFEYVQGGNWKEEGTNFDFYLKSGETEVFFEIKYTEEGFGTFDKNDKGNRHKKKYEGIYKKRIDECPAIGKDVKFDEDFRKNYQLIRNVIRVTDSKKYSLFVYDERNERIKKQFETFKKTFISKEYKDNVIGMTWQELVEFLDAGQHRKEFEEKYLNIEEI